MGFFKGVGNLFTGSMKTAITGVLNFMKPALMVLLFMPYITGMMTAVVVGLFPIIVLWSLFPGQHFKPLINYFLVLLFVQSAPLWYAIGDLMSTAAFSRFGGHIGGNYWQGIGLASWLEATAAGTFVAVLATFLVPMVEAVLLFGTWRAVAGALKGI